MREVKFRGWITKLNKWADGVEVYHDGSFNLSAEMPEGLVCGYAGILSQYTGLKDKNDKEIWENDIIECPFINHNCEEIIGIGLVYWAEGDGSFAINWGDHATFGLGVPPPCSYKVIGNKFENLELLEKINVS